MKTILVTKQVNQDCCSYYVYSLINYIVNYVYKIISNIILLNKYISFFVFKLHFGNSKLL